MRNPLSFRIESVTGAILMLAFSGFFVGLFYAFSRNFDSELVMFNSSNNNWLASVHASPQERQQMIVWVEKNEITLPETGDKIRYLRAKYPDRPWMNN